MNQEQFKTISQRHQAAEHKLRKAFLAFVSGGALALAGQLAVTFFENNMTKTDASTVVLLGVILLASLFTGLGIYDKAAQLCGAGLFVPISGFANSLASSAMECKNEGFIYGIGSNMFKLAGSVLTYGIVSALIFSAIRYGIGL